MNYTYSNKIAKYIDNHQVNRNKTHLTAFDPNLDLKAKQFYNTNCYSLFKLPKTGEVWSDMHIMEPYGVNEMLVYVKSIEWGATGWNVNYQHVLSDGCGHSTHLNRFVERFAFYF